MKQLQRLLPVLLFCLPTLVFAQDPKILVNQVGYSSRSVKHAVVMCSQPVPLSTFSVIDVNTGKSMFKAFVRYEGPVDKWKDWKFWTLDFSNFSDSGEYRLQMATGGKYVYSSNFHIGPHVLERYTLSDVIYYFKGQRCSGLLDKADRHIPIFGQFKDSTGALLTADIHGGWYDATGDYSKHLSHLTYSTYFNPQQIGLTDWALYRTFELLNQRDDPNFRQYKRRVLDEAMFGADYLVRLHVKDSSFYRSVLGFGGPEKAPEDRIVRPEEAAYRGNGESANYQVSYRSGGGMAIASLALASSFPVSGEFTQADYLKAAEDAFAFLEKNNIVHTNNGVENIVDDYCALMAATELYKATHKPIYKEAADKRANQLMARLTSRGLTIDYWRADEGDRPFFHAADAGLPVVSLLEYLPMTDSTGRAQVLETVKKSLRHELSVTNEVINPFGYARQLVQDTTGSRYTTFFFPHNTETSPWWQGENARLGSMATAARMAAGYFTEDSVFSTRLKNYALDQLNWILGCNPYDACMLQGNGHNNPAYIFKGHYEYTAQPGGIVNGITGGFDNLHDIDFNIPDDPDGADNGWRWCEQWLPHATWYMLAISTPAE